MLRSAWRTARACEAGSNQGDAGGGVIEHGYRIVGENAVCAGVSDTVSRSDWLRVSLFVVLRFWGGACGESWVCLAKGKKATNGVGRGD